MATRVAITAEPRTVLGKKVKRLRSEGLLPANIYGRGIESTPIQLDIREFMKTLRSSGIRVMFELTLDGESQARHVLIRGLDRRGGTGDPIHADFYQVELDREITTRVPIELTGEATAVRDLGGTLIQNLEYVNVRCLPTDIPDAFVVDIGVLDNFDAAIHVSDLQAPAGVTIADDEEVLVVTVTPPRIVATAAEEEELEEGEEAVEGEEAEEEAEEGGEAAEASEEE